MYRAGGHTGQNDFVCCMFRSINKGISCFFYQVERKQRMQFQPYAKTNHRLQRNLWISIRFVTADLSPGQKAALC